MNNFIDRDDIGLTNLEIFMCNGDYKAGLKMLLDKIEKAPTADVAPVRHGQWKSKRKWNYYVCSECSFENEIAFPYCPNCGARMDGGNDNG